MATGPLWQDVSFGVRILRRSPTFTIAAALSLALGIAAISAGFGIFNGLFLSSLPYPTANRLLYLHETAPAWKMSYLAVSYVDMDGWRRANRSFRDVAGLLQQGAELTGFGETMHINVASVTYNLAQTLGIAVVRGRDFRGEDDRAGSRLALLTYASWQRWFGGAPDAIGKSITLDQAPYTVIGVLPSNAAYPANTDVWVPLGYDSATPGYVLDVVGRLKPGVSVQQASADLARIHRQIPAAHSHNAALTFPVAVPLRQHYLGDYRVAAQWLLVASILVLLAASANVAGLTMARGAARSREVAVRRALGAGSGRIARQLLVEGAVLASTASVAGMALGWLSLRALLALSPDVLPPWVEFHLDARVLGFTCATMALVVLTSGVGPVLQSRRVDLQSALADDSAKSTLTGNRKFGLRLLVVGEVALAVILLTGGGLALAAFRQVTSRPAGFHVAKILTFSINPSTMTADQRLRLCRDLLRRLRSSSAVEAAGATDYLPLGPGLLGRGDWAGWAFQPEGKSQTIGSAGIRTVTPGYFRAMGTALRAGRDFEDRDLVVGSRLVMVNEAFARSAWPGEPDVIGRRFRGFLGPEWLSVVGVVQDTRHSGLEKPVRPEVFVPYLPDYTVPLTIALRGRIEAPALVVIARRAMQETDRSLAIFDLHTMQELLDRSLWARRASSWLLEVFAGLSLLMAGAGIYSVVSYSVSQRTREIAVRMALGADRSNVIGEVFREGMMLAAMGVAIGTAGAWYAARQVSSLLADVNPHDPRIFAGVAGMLAGVALLAHWLPALRAASVDPWKALRS